MLGRTKYQYYCSTGVKVPVYQNWYVVITVWKLLPSHMQKMMIWRKKRKNPMMWLIKMGWNKPSHINLVSHYITPKICIHIKTNNQIHPHMYVRYVTIVYLLIVRKASLIQEFSSKNDIFVAEHTILSISIKTITRAVSCASLMCQPVYYPLWCKVQR